MPSINDITFSSIKSIVTTLAPLVIATVTVMIWWSSTLASLTSKEVYDAHIDKIEARLLTLATKKDIKLLLIDLELEDIESKKQYFRDKAKSNSGVLLPFEQNEYNRLTNKEERLDEERKKTIGI